MKARTKLIIFSILLITIAVAIACIMVFSFAKTHMLNSEYSAGVADYHQFISSFQQAENSIADQNTLAYFSNLKYTFRNVKGSEEFALQDGEEIISNNTGIDASRFLRREGQADAEDPDLRYGYASAAGASYLVIGGDIMVYEHTYQLSLVRDITDVIDGVNTLALQCAVCCLILLIVAAILMFVLVTRTMKPLSVLQQGVKRVANGEYREYIHIKGKNEFSELAEQYNNMAKAIDDKIHQIEKTSEDRKLLLSSISHEMRTPVTAIAAYAHSLSRVRMTEAQKQEAIGLIGSESLRLERLSSKLMQLLSTGAQKEIKLAKVTSRELEENLQAAITPVAKQNNFTIDYRNEKETVYWGEKDLLICLLTNLVDNARKAGATRIIVEFLQNKISVADNGCGIPAEKIPELTEPFFKLDSSRNTEGFGLGLTLAARIAQLHHARLIFKSEVGRGTTVSLTF